MLPKKNPIKCRANCDTCKKETDHHLWLIAISYKSNHVLFNLICIYCLKNGKKEPEIAGMKLSEWNQIIETFLKKGDQNEQN